jgi:tRNA A-37 threonylcarbamoyl transferase component Bud32
MNNNNSNNSSNSNDDEQYYIKKNVKQHEVDMHQHIYDLELPNIHVPKIVNYNKTTKEMTLVKIDNMNISDWYGAAEKNITPQLFDNIRQIIKTLYDNNIIYPDITGYNFIEHDNKLWILDFEHSYFNNHKHTQFVKKFIKGMNKWNPNFK